MFLLVPLLLFLLVLFIAILIESFRYLPLNVTARKITTLIMLAVLFVGAGFVIYEFGLQFDELDTYTQLAFIRTMMLIVIPIAALTLDFMKSNEEDKLRRETKLLP